MGINTYHDLAFTRLMLLISAIANNPGIAPQSTGISPMQALLAAMEDIANQQGIEWQEWSEATIRKDLVTLRRYGILPQNTAQRGGYRLGQKDKPDPPSKPVKALTERDMEIMRLRAEGKSLAEVGKVVGLSRERVRQIESQNKSGRSHPCP